MSTPHPAARGFGTPTPVSSSLRAALSRTRPITLLAALQADLAPMGPSMEVAKYLDRHNSVAKVNYTGLQQHPDFNTSAKQMRHPGPMMSIELKGGLEAGKKFIDKLQMCTRAVSLGTTDTLISHPASMSHYSVAKESREQFGITDGLIRMSIGIENLQDILADLEQALRP